MQGSSNLRSLRRGAGCQCLLRAILVSACVCAHVRSAAPNGGAAEGGGAPGGDGPLEERARGDGGWSGLGGPGGGGGAAAIVGGANPWLPGYGSAAHSALPPDPTERGHTAQFPACFPSAAACPNAVGAALTNGELARALADVSGVAVGRPPAGDDVGGGSSTAAGAGPGAAGGLVVMTVFHSYHLPALRLKLEAVRERFPHRLAQWLLVALDPLGHAACLQWARAGAEQLVGLHCALDPAAAAHPITAADIQGPTAQHLLFRWRCLEIVAVAVASGYDVLHSSPTLAWAADPVPALERDQPPATLQVLPLSPTAVCSYNSPVGSVSSNFYMWRASEHGRAFARAWVAAGARGVHRERRGGFHEMKGLNAALRDWDPEALATFPWRGLLNSSQLVVRQLHPATLPGDEHMYKLFSHACSAQLYPPRSSWAPPMALQARHLAAFLEESAACAAAPPPPPLAPWRADCRAPFVTADDDAHTEAALGGGEANHSAFPPAPPPVGAQRDLEDSAQPGGALAEPAAAAAAAAAAAGLPAGFAGRCARGCYAKGTCHEELARCDCPVGWTGPACEAPFEWGSFLTGPQRLDAAAAREQRQHPNQEDAKLCPLDCGGAQRGRCFMRGPAWNVPMCLCVNGWGGAGCRQRAKTYCMGGCGGRGRCEAGFCHCLPGLYGVDCGLALGPDGKTSVLVPYEYHANRSTEQSAPGAPLVYVYELPPWLNVWLYAAGSPVASYAYQDGKWGGSILQSFQPGGFYVGPNEVMLHERLLSSARRTLDPAAADFFFVPAWGQVAKNVGGGITEGGGMAAYWASVRTYVQRTWPFWDRHRGADHLWVVMGDHGACEAPRGAGIPPALRDSILLSNWGLHTDSHATGLKPYLDLGPCFRPGQDIVIPAPLNSGHALSPFRLNATKRHHWQHNRSQLIYFKGQMNWGGAGMATVEDGQPMYSHGVRQRMWQTYGDANLFPDVYINRDGADASRALFCLAPTGLGFGVRVVHSIMEGCIPLIIQDNVTQAYQYEFLPYSLFSVTLREAEIPRARDILLEISAERIASMQRELACVWPYLLWSSVYGRYGTESGYNDAFEALMGVLQRRKEGVPYRETSLCPRRSTASINSRDEVEVRQTKPVCHMYCDSWPQGPPPDSCTMKHVKTENICPKFEWQPAWQPWPSGCALQT